MVAPLVRAQMAIAQQRLKVAEERGKEAPQPTLTGRQRGHSPGPPDIPLALWWEQQARPKTSQAREAVSSAKSTVPPSVSQQPETEPKGAPVSSGHKSSAKLKSHRSSER